MPSERSQVPVGLAEILTLVLMGFLTARLCPGFISHGHFGEEEEMQTDACTEVTVLLECCLFK